MNQDKLDVVKQEMARVNVDIIGISELRWTVAIQNPSVHGISQARILKWVSISFSMGSS